MNKPSGTAKARAYKTLSGIPIEPVYTRADTPAPPKPGEFPYTRGIHPDMYRGKLWTMRQFSGFATPEETNQRYHYLLEQGQTGLSVAFDLPTLMGYDADHAMTAGRSGQVRRRHRLARRHGDRSSDGIPLGEVTRLDDHQLAGVGAVGHVPGGGGAAGRRAGRGSPARCRTTS